MAGIFSYAKTLWQDGVTAITAARLNHIEQGISDAANSIKTLGDSVSRYKYGIISARVEANSTGTYDIDVGGDPKTTFANAMSANKSVRAQAKSADGNKITIVVINGESYVWEGSVSWFAII